MARSRFLRAGRLRRSCRVRRPCLGQSPDSRNAGAAVVHNFVEGRYRGYGPRLAAHIVETKSGHFEPEKFEDHYEDALKELLKKKKAGEKIEAPKERAPAKVINLMDALRRSVDAERGGSAKRQAPSAKARGSESERPKKKKSR